MGAEKVSDVVYTTFVHVRNANTFCDSLKWKYEHTCNIWKKIDTDTDTDTEEAP